MKKKIEKKIRELEKRIFEIYDSVEEPSLYDMANLRKEMIILKAQIEILEDILK